MQYKAIISCTDINKAPVEESFFDDPIVSSNFCRPDLELIESVKKYKGRIACIFIPASIEHSYLERLKTEISNSGFEPIIPIIVIGRITSDQTKLLKTNRIFYTFEDTSDTKLLISVLKSAVGEFFNLLRLHQHTNERSVFRNLLKSGSFEIRTLDEATDLITFLSSSCENSRAVAVGLSELIINAIEHGNLEIDFDTKTSLIEQGNWLEEIKIRCANPKYADRFVQVDFIRRNGNIIFKIKDQGNGFDWRPYVNFSKERLTLKHGRGIAMAKETVFDCVEYSEKGNQVTATLFTHSH